MTSEINRYYRTLEVEPGASLEQVKQAWRDQVKVWHPDRFPNDVKLQRKAQERLKDINCAYDILEQHLTSGTPSTRNRPSSSQASDRTQQQKSERRETESSRTETPPPSPTERTQTEPKKSGAGVALAVVGCILVLLLISAISGGNSDHTSSSSSYGNPSVGSGSGFTPPPPQAYVPPPVSKALDEKNGFKDFKFGMTPQEARELLPPSTVTDLPGANAIVFHYRETPANRIGEFSTDNLSLKFFDGHLHRIDIKFSSFPAEIFEACMVNYGKPSDDAAWTRGDQKLTGKSWRGEKIQAVVLSQPNQAWDSLVICNIQANQKAQEFAEKEPERAAKDFGPTGFKSLVMGAKLQDLTVEYEVVKEDRVSAVKEVAFKKGDWQTVGFYPLRNISAEFFNDRLYRINLGFKKNHKEIFAAFEQRFGPLQENDTWTRGTTKLKAKVAAKDKFFGAILAPQNYPDKEHEWDFIVLYDSDIWREAEQFKNDAPKRAAKDF